jgi:hypothetical protein
MFVAVENSKLFRGRMIVAVVVPLSSLLIRGLAKDPRHGRDDTPDKLPLVRIAASPAPPSSDR